MSIPGRWSEVKPVDLDVINICLELQKPIEERVKNSSGSDVYIPVSFISQVVAGKNYVVKVFIGRPDVCIHAKIFQALPCNGGNLSVTGFQFPKKFKDPLIHF